MVRWLAEAGVVEGFFEEPIGRVADEAKLILVLRCGAVDVVQLGLYSLVLPLELLLVDPRRMVARGCPRQQLRLERGRLLFVREDVPIRRGQQGEAADGLRHGLPIGGDAGLNGGASLRARELLRLVEKLPVPMAHIRRAWGEAHGLFNQRECLLWLIGLGELFCGAHVAADVVGPTRSEQGQGSSARIRIGGVLQYVLGHVL